MQKSPNLETAPVGEQGASAQPNTITISSALRRGGKTGGDQRGPMDNFVVRNRTARDNETELMSQMPDEQRREGDADGFAAEYASIGPLTPSVENCKRAKDIIAETLFQILPSSRTMDRLTKSLYADQINTVQKPLGLRALLKRLEDKGTSDQDAQEMAAAYIEQIIFAANVKTPLANGEGA